jgi:hypothetical protein
VCSVSYNGYVELFAGTHLRLICLMISGQPNSCWFGRDHAVAGGFR